MNRKIAELLSGLLAFMSVFAQASESEWKIGYVSKLGEFVQSCIGPTCENEQQEFVRRLTKVCMYRDKATSGFFTRGDWKAAINPAEQELCQEVLFADIFAKVLYLEAPLMRSSGTFLAGQQYIHCTPDNGRGESSLCSPARPMYCKNSGVEAKPSGYDACSSEFFAPYDANPRFRFLQASKISQVIRESNLLATIDQYVAYKAKQAAEAEVAMYHSAFDNAKTLESIRTFESRYAGNDPEGLIAKLAAIKRTLQIEEYRQRFALMRSVGEIESFISDYKGDDPDTKLPEARRRLAEEQQKVIAEKKRIADENSENEKMKRLSDLEREIIWCHRKSIDAQEAIDRENRIGHVSGYVDKTILRRAGEIIVSCDESIPKKFLEYKRLGGPKQMAEMK